MQVIEEHSFTPRCILFNGIVYTGSYSKFSTRLWDSHLPGLFHYESDSYIADTYHSYVSVT